MKSLGLAVVIVALLPTLAFGQDRPRTETVPGQTEEEGGYPRHYLGSSLWMLWNFTEDSAEFYQLTYGYHLTRKDVLLVEGTTWKYNEPLGTYGDSEELYPGKVRAFGIGVGYQRFHWKNVYTTVEATSFLQQFYDEDDEKIQKGFQLYCQLIAGYRFEFFEKRLFVEPAYALKYWPVNTNFPASFAEIEEGKPEHKFEPSLNFGVRF